MVMAGVFRKGGLRYFFSRMKSKGVKKKERGGRTLEAAKNELGLPGRLINCKQYLENLTKTA